MIDGRKWELVEVGRYILAERAFSGQVYKGSTGLGVWV